MSGRKFKDYSLGARLRIQVGNAVAPFGTDDQLFGSQQLRAMLICVLKFKQYEVSYQLLKILAYGKNKFKNLRIQQLISYLFEQYIGETSINNYSKKHAYICQEGKLMTKSEFISTINMGLSFIQGRNLESDRPQLSKLFDQINCKGFNMISHDDYLQCMKEYFGSLSPMAINRTEKIIKIQNSQFLSEQEVDQKQQVGVTTKGSSNQNVQTKLLEISSNQKTQQIGPSSSTALEQLRDLIVTEIKNKCSQFDKDSDQKLDKDQTYSFFYQVLMLQKHSIQYILENYFHFQQCKEASFLELTQVISEVHFRQIFSSLLKQETSIDNPNKILLNQEQFSNKLLQSCFFFKNKPSLQLISKVFAELINRSQLKLSDCISLEDFRAFILAFLCKSKMIFRQSFKRNTQYALMNLPISITQAQNSNYQEDSSYNEVRPRQFDSSINESRLEQNVFDQRFQNGSKLSNNKASGPGTKAQSHQLAFTDNQYSIQQNNQHMDSARVMIETQYVLVENPIKTDFLIENNELKQQPQISKQQQSVKIIYTEIESKSAISDENPCSQEQQNLNAKAQIKAYIKNLTGIMSIQQIVNQYSQKKIASNHQIKEQSSQNKVQVQENLVSIHQQFNFKQKLWNRLKNIFQKYSQFPHRAISREKIQFLTKNQQIFIKKQSKLKQKLQLYFKKSQEISIQLLISFTVHILGQQALIRFNKTQIKGKSTLQQQQLANILFDGYDLILNQQKENYRSFSHHLIQVSNTPQFTYNSLLTFIGRNLSVKPDN